MKKKRILIISSIVFVIIVAALFVSYGYITAEISGNESSKKTAFGSQVLKIEYSDGTETLTSNQGVFTPGSKIEKTFTVKNTGNVKIKFDIDLTNVTNKFVRKQDITYSIKSGDTLLSQNIFPTYDQTIHHDMELEVNESKNFTLIIEYLNSEENQIVDSGTEPLRATISFSDANENPYSKGTLPYYIYENGALVHNKTENKLEIDKTYEEKSIITKISDGTDMTDTGLFILEDDYGDSYYYRGPVKNNYVEFAGFMWRVVRINGNGSVRLILDGTLDKVCADYEKDSSGNCSQYAGTTSAFNPSSNDNAYVGYMYGFTGITSEVCIKTDEDGRIKSIGTETDESSCRSNGGVWTNPYDATHMNINDSRIKTNIDKFYETYILNNYNNYLSDTLFCNDKTIANTNSNLNTKLGYGKNRTYYGVVRRLNFDENEKSLFEIKPSLKCANGTTNNYSRFTVSEHIINNVETNGNLTYPIALLSADEAVLAGLWTGKGNKENTNFYLTDASKEGKSAHYIWLNTPYLGGMIPWTTIGIALSDENIECGYINYIHVDPGNIGTPPVINLKSNLLVESGDGTSDGGAYKVKLPN